MNQCSCTPLKYRWKLNFNATCPPENVSFGSGTGINGVVCRINGGLDPRPVVLTSVQVLEFDNTPLSVKKSMTWSDASFTDGHVIEFDSVTMNNTSFISWGLSVIVEGLNANDDQVMMEWIVSNSNLCDIEPYKNGDSLGWFIFVSTLPYQSGRIIHIFIKFFHTEMKYSHSFILSLRLKKGKFCSSS